MTVLCRAVELLMCAEEAILWMLLAGCKGMLLVCGRCTELQKDKCNRRSYGKPLK